MEVSARLSSKGQVTVPRAVRKALSLEEGDRVVFRVEGQRARLARTSDLPAMAGSVPVPAGKRGTPWVQVRRQNERHAPPPGGDRLRRHQRPDPTPHRRPTGSGGEGDPIPATCR